MTTKAKEQPVDTFVLQKLQKLAPNIEFFQLMPQHMITSLIERGTQSRRGADSRPPSPQIGNFHIRILGLGNFHIRNWGSTPNFHIRIVSVIGEPITITICAYKINSILFLSCSYKMGFCTLLVRPSIIVETSSYSPALYMYSIFNRYS